MSVSTTGGMIRYVDMHGDQQIAVYSTLELAQSDAEEMLAAKKAGSTIVIGTHFVNINRTAFEAEVIVTITPT
jgi:hypothetical protein